jgi:nicotinamide mononucleotide transporter
MSDFFSVKNIAFSAYGYDMSWLELVATFAGLAAVWLSAKERILSWPIGLVNVILSFFVFFQFNLYSDMFLQIYFFLTGVYGWWQWTRQDKAANEKVVKISPLTLLDDDILTEAIPSNDKVVKISYLTRQQQVGMVVAILILTIVTGASVGHFHQWFPTIFQQPAAFPYADTLVMVMSLFGNLLLTVKKIESWILWVLVDIIAPIIYFQKGMILFTIMYIVFLGIAIFALLNWLKIYREQQRKPSFQ